MIRRAEIEDCDTLIGLIEALASYEELEPPSMDARLRLRSDGWPLDGSNAKFTAWLVETEQDGHRIAVGYAITFPTYSTFLARPTLYLEDIFVLPDYRRGQFGSTLMEHLLQIAGNEGCGRMEWVVLDWNTSAQTFYAKFNAAQLKEWLHYRITL